MENANEIGSFIGTEAYHSFKEEFCAIIEERADNNKIDTKLSAEDYKIQGVANNIAKKRVEKAFEEFEIKKKLEDRPDLS